MTVGRPVWIVGGALLIGTTVLAFARSRGPSGHARAEETRRIRDLYEREATRYDRVIQIPERLLFGDGRAWTASVASGDVLEIAIGTGRNLPVYPRGVRITGQDISPAMLAIAIARAQALGRRVDLHAGDAQELALPGSRFDSVVSTLSLCTIPDARRALAEIWRVLAPRGGWFCSSMSAVLMGSCARCSMCSSRSRSGARATICCAIRSTIWACSASRSSSALAARRASSSGSSPANGAPLDRQRRKPSDWREGAR